LGTVGFLTAIGATSATQALICGTIISRCRTVSSSMAYADKLPALSLQVLQ
jgi:hypothetical protein